MANRLRVIATLLSPLMFLNVVTADEHPRASFEVVSVVPTQVIKHEVEVNGPFDHRVVERYLVGPKMFSQQVGLQKSAAGEPKAYLNWFQISRPIEEPERVLSVRDALRGKDAEKVTIQNVAYLLSPAQRITSGTPADIPKDLNYFMAYTIKPAREIERQVKVAGGFGPEDRTTAKAVLLCVPVDHWHHHDHSPIKNADRCLVVYELVPHQHKTTVNTIDQFGLNKLTTNASTWLCVDAQIVDGKSADTN